LKSRGRGENEIQGNGRKFKFLQLEGGRIAPFGFFCGSDGLAHRAGMLAIESPDQGFGEGMGAQIVGQHRRPGNGLQQGPLRAEHDHEHKDNQRFANFYQHIKDVREIIHKVKWIR
jgi:hypothetical protein